MDSLPALPNVGWSEVAFLLVEAVGVWLVARKWRESGRQVASAADYRVHHTDPVEALEARAMQMIAEDRRRRQAVLLTFMVSGVVIAIWSMLTPPPIRNEMRAFALGSILVLILRDVLLVWSSSRSLAAGRRIDAIIRERRHLLAAEKEGT